MRTSMTTNKGTALITSLVLLMALTMVSLSAVQSTSVQLQISGNDEATVEAYQYAQSVVDAVIEQPSNFVVGTGAGFTLCAVAESGCDQVSIPLTSTMFSSVTGLQAKVEHLKTSAAPRMGANASSATAFDGAYFTIAGRYNETANNRGLSNVVQGFVMLIPKT